jgi:hypothetical protein
MLAVTSTSGLRALATAVRLMPGVYYVTWLQETVHVLAKVTAFYVHRMLIAKTNLLHFVKANVIILKLISYRSMKITRSSGKN